MIRYVSDNVQNGNFPHMFPTGCVWGRSCPSRSPLEWGGGAERRPGWTSSGQLKVLGSGVLVGDEGLGQGILEKMFVNLVKSNK